MDLDNSKILFDHICNGFRAETDLCTIIMEIAKLGQIANCINGEFSKKYKSKRV